MLIPKSANPYPRYHMLTVYLNIKHSPYCFFTSLPRLIEDTFALTSALLQPIRALLHFRVKFHGNTLTPYGQLRGYTISNVIGQVKVWGRFHFEQQLLLNE